MPPRRPKDKGTDAERAVVRYLQANGFPHAERRALNGSTDRGDVTGCPGLVIEVKHRDRESSDLQINQWLDETETERLNAHADIGLLVVRRRYARPDNWSAWLPSVLVARLIDPGCAPYAEAPVFPVRMLLGDAVLALRWAGYGEPLEATRGDA